MKKTFPLTGALCAAILLALTATSTQAAPVNLNDWTVESYPMLSGFPAPDWTVSGDTVVVQSTNAQPTLFYSDFNAQGLILTGTIEVQTTSDDDYFGVALGFNPGDTTNAGADYLLVDWKQATQTFDFEGNPSTGEIGMALSRVTGTPSADDLWGHEDFAGTGGAVDELARATNLGSTGWADNTPYDFEIQFTSTSLKVFVDGVLEIDQAGSFNDGRFAFYNFSQSQVQYSNFSTVPEPTSMALFGLTALGFGASFRRRRQAQPGDSIA